MKLLRRSILVLGLVACSTAPTAPAGLHIRVEPNASVLTAGDPLRVRATITNESSSAQQIAGLSCQAIVYVFAKSANTQLPVSDPRLCTLIAGTTTLLPHEELSDVLTFATTKTTGTPGALSEGSYRLQAQFAVIGHGLLRSDYATVTVAR